MIRILQKNLHFSICNFHFSMKFSVSFQKAKLIRQMNLLNKNFYHFIGGTPQEEAVKKTTQLRQLSCPKSNLFRRFGRRRGTSE
jgi:hypothetical protein